MDAHEATSLSRRRFLAAAGAAGATLVLAPRRMFGEHQWPSEFLTSRPGPVQQIRKAAATDPVRVQSLRGNISVLLGSGGNVAALPGADGVLLIDSGIVGPKIAAAVATFTRTPIRHLVNTHWHFDHTDANAWLHAQGSDILAQENTRKHLATNTRVEDWDFTFPASPTGALPATVFTTERTLQLNGSRIALKKYAPAHTDSDISVHFGDVDVLHVADTWWNGLYPFIDYSTGGSLDGTIRATDENLRRVSPSTIIIPGHGAVGDRVALLKYRDMLGVIRDRVATLKKQGRTANEVVAAKPTASFDAVWGGSVIDPASFTRLVYKGV